MKLFPQGYPLFPKRATGRSQQECLRPQSRPIPVLGRLTWVKLGARDLTDVSGFTLTEVLVAMMLSLIFLSITMQMFVTAAYFRARSTQYNYAYNWMQEDFEEVLNKARQYEMVATPYSTACNASDASRGLAASFLKDSTSGLGGSSVSLGTRNFGGLSYTMTRTGSYTGTRDPQKLLQVSYAVTPSEGGAPVAELETEVVIYAGFKCPVSN